MKMMYNGTQIKSLNIKHYELSSNFATVEPSDMQAGKTAVARGKKITGTGKSFSFATYGRLITNLSLPISSDINIIEIASVDYPIKHEISFSNITGDNFIGETTIAKAVISNVEYPINMVIENNTINFVCDKTINIEVFYGKDMYI